MAERPDEIRRLSSREVFRNPWLRVRDDEIEYADGSRGSYAVVEKQDFVCVVPWTGPDESGFWLVEQFRYPVGVRAWEFPQGGWGAGASGSMDELARAELLEEAGLSAGGLRRLGRLYAAYGYCSQSFDVYVATDLTEGAPHREVTEQDMRHQWFSEQDVRAMVADGAFPDSHSVAALALFDMTRGVFLQTG